jgi:hypothetical protein
VRLLFHHPYNDEIITRTYLIRVALQSCTHWHYTTRLEFGLIDLSVTHVLFTAFTMSSAVEQVGRAVSCTAPGLAPRFIQTRELLLNQ